MRFDGFKYRDCPWCQGEGCLACEAEADKAYARAFPNGPVPLATFDISTAEGLAIAQKAIGAGAMTKAFGPGGGGIEEILDNAVKAMGASK